jgi:hypothetical protein
MKRIYQMYKYTSFIRMEDEAAENDRDSEGNLHYRDSYELVRDYAELNSTTESFVAHLQGSCVENGYLWTRHDHIHVDDGKGAKLLDTFCGIRIGLLEEILRQYSYSTTLFSGAVFLGIVVTLWHTANATVHHVWPHIYLSLKHHL